MSRKQYLCSGGIKPVVLEWGR